ncbi:MAG: glycosyltransferase family 39 protein [Bacteroidetes bacterium]|nr:glycosyltransferase family 39 protein [Bacteroidota bacterium]
MYKAMASGGTDEGTAMRHALQLIVLIVLLQLFVTLLTDGFALSFDESMWHYIGRNWFRHGLVPYSGGIDNKSPLIFAVFGLSDSLFGVNYFFPRILGAAVESIGIYYLYKIARIVAGERTGILAVSFYGLSLLWHTTGGKYVSYTETYEVTLIIVAFYYALNATDRKEMFIGGLTAGIGFWFRITAAFGIVAIFIALLLKHRRKIIPFCAGVLSGILIIALICLLAGISFRDLLTYTIIDNFGPGSATDHNLAWRIHNLSAKFLYSGMVLFYLPVLLYIAQKKKIDTLVLWLMFAFIGINAVGIYDNVHLKEVLPALSVTSACAITRFAATYKIFFKAIIVIVWIAFLPSLGEATANLKRLIGVQKDNPVIYCREPYPIPGEGDRKKLGQWIKANSTRQQKVYVAGYGAQVQAYSERISPTVYFNVTQTALAKQRFFKDMQANKPDMILVPLFPEYKQNVDGDICRFVDSLVAKQYTSQGCQFNYAVYRRK